MKNITTFRNRETNEVFTASELNNMPVGVYDATDAYWLMLIVTHDRNIVISSWNYAVDQDGLNDEFESKESMIVTPEYRRCERNGDDYARSKGWLI